MSGNDSQVATTATSTSAVAQKPRKRVKVNNGPTQADLRTFMHDNLDTLQVDTQLPNGVIVGQYLLDEYRKRVRGAKKSQPPPSQSQIVNDE